MNIAALNVRITFQRKEIAADAVGNHISQWKEYFVTHATVNATSGSEQEGAIVTLQKTLEFTTRYCSELAAVDSTHFRIIAEEAIYNIVFINPMGFHHNSLKFRCELAKEDI